MARIPIHVLPGNNVLHKLLNYFKARASLKDGFHIIVPTVTASAAQRGQNCKLVALANAIEHAANKAKVPHLPLYKNKRHTLSLRQLAKTYGGSKVGEMYSLESMITTSRCAGFEAVAYTAFNEDDYISQLKAYVDENQVPIVFYDADLSDDRYGFPHIGDGKNEHAVIVVAYYYNKDHKIRFIVNSWGYFFDFDGLELAVSACHSLVDKREPETFRKCQALDGMNKWLLFNDIPTNAIPIADLPLRTADSIGSSDRSLKGKIMIIAGPIQSQHRQDFFTAVRLDKKTIECGEENTCAN